MARFLVLLGAAALAALGALYLRAPQPSVAQQEAAPVPRPRLEADSSAEIGNEMVPVDGQAGPLSAVVTPRPTGASEGPDAAARAEEQPGAVRIRAVDGVSGEPLAAAAFTYYHDSAVHLGSTDEAGTARIEVSAGEWVGSIRLRRSDDHAGSKAASARPEAGEEVPITLTSQPGGTLEGTTVLEDGRFVPNAEVLVWNGSTVRGEPDARVLSGDDGGFSIPRVGESFIAAAQTDSQACLVGLRGTITPDTKCRDLTLVLTPARAFEGVVLDESGGPIEAAHLKLSTGLNGRSSRDSTSTDGITVFRGLGGANQETFVTGADGRFRFEHQPNGAIQVRVEALGFVGQWMQSNTERSPVTFTLGRGLVMRGTVVLPSGEPAVGARVRFSPKPQNTKVRGGSVAVGADGSFELSGLNPESRDEAYLTAALAGHAVEALEPPVFDEGQGQSNLIRLEAAQPLAGVIRSADGGPAEGIRVVLDGGGRFSAYNSFVGQIRSYETAAGVDATTSDSQGRFAFQHRRRGDAALRVYPGEDRARWLDVAVAADQEFVEVGLDPEVLRMVVLKGVATDAATGEPLPRCSLLVWRDGTGRTHEVETEEGAFELAGLRPGELKIEARCEGYAPRVLVEDDFAIGEHDLGPVALTPAINASVLVVDLDGEPWKTGALGLMDTKGEDVSFSPYPGSRTTIALLNGQPVSLGGIPDAPMTMVVRADGVTREVGFQPALARTNDGPYRITVERPARATRYELMVIVLDGSKLEDRKAFTAMLKRGTAVQDEEWAKANMLELIAAGPRGNATIKATSAEGFPSSTEVTWDEARQLYTMEISAVTSSSLGSSSKTSFELEVPVPFFSVEHSTRGPSIDLSVLIDGSTVATRTVAVEELIEGSDRLPPTVVLTY